MKNIMTSTVLILFLIAMSSSVVIHGLDDHEKKESMFMLDKSKQMFRTEAGEVRMQRGRYEDDDYEAEGIRRGHIQIGFIRMEPKSFFLPQYLTSDLVFFIETGSARLGWVHGNDLIEKDLKLGDVYRIPGGAVFYLLNRNKGQRLHIIFCVDTSTSLFPEKVQSFFVAGGLDPVPVLSGFDDRLLSRAFNVSRRELDDLRMGQSQGPIIYISDREHDILRSKSKPFGSWEWRYFYESFVSRKGASRRSRKFDGYNMFKDTPDFRNDHGWSIAVDNDDYSSLNEPDIGLFYVNLSAGAMMAHHYNPRGAEYGIITRGEGRIQIAFPNGTRGMDKEVGVGDVFWVPQYYPVCQIAARSAPLEFFGFSTSAKGNRPQFLTGRNSVLNVLGSRNLAPAFNMSEKRLNDILRAQKEVVILPPLTPKEQQEHQEEEGGRGKRRRGRRVMNLLPSIFWDFINVYVYMLRRRISFFLTDL